MFFTVRFHVLSIRCCGFSTDLVDPHFPHPALRWPRIYLADSVPPPLPSLTFADGSGGSGVLGFRGSDSLCSLPVLFVLSTRLFRGEFWDLFVISFLIIYYFIYWFLFSSLIFVQDCCCVAVTCGGISRMGTDSTRCMVFSSFTDTVHLT